MQFLKRLGWRIHLGLMEASKWLNRALAVVVLGLLAACAVMTAEDLETRTVYVEYSETNDVEQEYARILADAGYRLVSHPRDAEYTARLYHEQRTNYCNEERRVFIRARMVIESDTNTLDMSSTERCALDTIAAHLMIRDALDHDRSTYLRRLRSF